MIDLSIDQPTFWKDKLVGHSSKSVYKELDEKEDFDILEGDSQKSFVNGVPFISFSDRIHQILIQGCLIPTKERPNSLGIGGSSSAQARSLLDQLRQGMVAQNLLAGTTNSTGNLTAAGDSYGQEIGGSLINNDRPSDLGYCGPSFTWQRGGTFVRSWSNLMEVGTWILFHVWLSEDVIYRIISIPPPHLDSGADKNISWSATEVAKVFISWARQFESYFSGYKSNVSNLNPVNIFDNTRLLLSTDDVVARETGYAATRWKLDYGIQSLFRRIIIHTDNLEVVQALTDLGLEDSGITVLRRTQRIIKSEGQWKINHIPREQNLVADRLAKLSLNWKSTL
ncbi:hypothetical protein Gotri_000191 [Gossypium trilobum]|uniref:RNase H type-1 domain-containing protein n=1 Tax=Gossypium trilobum TaxID=34281 RepID=A0A7J9FS72_9ROSI|nr:hypothetical protein [Gossypium trilobum]